MTPTTTTHAPPPPPDLGDLPPPTSASGARRRTVWRERLPELVGGIGTVLVLAAVAGFLSARWEELDRIGRAIVLGGAAAGLTAAATFLEARVGARLRTLTSMLWVTGSVTAGAAVVLAASVALPGLARITALLAGGVIAAHALWAARREPGSALRQVGVVGGLLVAAGPFGTSLADRVGWATVSDAFVPLVGLVDPTLASDAYAITGVAHLLIGAGWLLWACRSQGRPARVGWIGSTAILAYAALQLHVLPWGIGAFAALLLVLAYLVHGLVTDRAGAVVTGSIGVLVAGGRVLWSLFSGEVVVTVAAFTVGLALLGWAVRTRSGTSGLAD